MRENTWLKAVVLAAALTIAALGTRAQQDPAQQSTGDAVADAARKARAEKKEAPKSKKVYTDDDVSKMRPVTTAAATATGNPEEQKPAETAKADGSAASGASEEAGWRKKFKDLHDKIAAAEKELDVLQRESEKAQVQYYSDPQKAMNEQYSRKDINDKNSKIDAKKQEITQLKQQQDDLEDALRKSGGDPGWAR
jgi:hypothetical protein